MIAYGSYSDMTLMFNKSHELKGAAATMGCIALQKASSDLCERTRDGVEKDVTVEVTRVVNEWDRVMSQLQKTKTLTV